MHAAKQQDSSHRLRVFRAKETPHAGLSQSQSTHTHVFGCVLGKKLLLSAFYTPTHSTKEAIVGFLLFRATKRILGGSELIPPFFLADAPWLFALVFFESCHYFY